MKCFKSEAGSSSLKKEIEVLTLLPTCPCTVHLDIPKLIETSADNESPYIVMELLGSTLEQLRRELPFTPVTIAMIGVQLINAFESVHDAGVIHRDVKPDNLAVSLNSEDHNIYIFDFGSATKYLINGMHIKYREETGYVGNSLFSSHHVMQRVRSSRRDDMESIGYVLLYLHDKDLPWSDIYSTDHHVRGQQMQVKLEINTASFNSAIAQEYIDFIGYCRSLHFEERPNYAYLRNLLMTAALRFGFTGSWDYDWLPKAVQEVPKLTENLSSHIPFSPPKRNASRKKTMPVHMMRGLDSAEAAPGQLMSSLKTDNSGPCTTVYLKAPTLIATKTVSFSDFTEIYDASTENCSVSALVKVMSTPDIEFLQTGEAETPRQTTQVVVDMARLKLKATEGSTRKCE